MKGIDRTSGGIPQVAPNLKWRREQQNLLFSRAVFSWVFMKRNKMRWNVFRSMFKIYCMFKITFDKGTLSVPLWFFRDTNAKRIKDARKLYNWQVLYIVNLTNRSFQQSDSSLTIFPWNIEIQWWIEQICYYSIGSAPSCQKSLGECGTTAIHPGWIHGEKRHFWAQPVCWLMLNDVFHAYCIFTFYARFFHPTSLLVNPNFPSSAFLRSFEIAKFPLETCLRNGRNLGQSTPM